LQARVPSKLTWAIIQIIIETLNPIVHQCLLNYNRGYWLLSNVLSIVLAIMGTTRMKYDHQITIIPSLQCGEFDQEIEILYGIMVVEFISVLCHFLSFAKSFSREKNPQHGYFDVGSTLQRHGSHHGLHWQ
jgi:hypothetical protein